MRRLSIIAVVLLAALVGVGCGGSKKKETTAGGPVLDGSTTGGAGGPVGDQSTGDAVPTGPGEAAPDQHEMAEGAKSFYNEGVRQGAAGNLGQAEQAFKRALQEDPKSHRAIYNLGVVSERKGDDESARGYYRQAFSLQPDYLPALSAFAKLEIRLGNVETAVSVLKEKATAYPKHLGIINAYADALIAAQRYNDAISVAKHALKQDERNAVAMMRVAKANVRMGRFELAESIFNQVIGINPDIAEVYFLRAQIKMQDGLKAEAIKELETALEKNPYYIEAMNNLSVQYILSGNYQAAIDMLEGALRLSPSWGVLYLNYGNALRGAGRWQEARVNLEKARQIDPQLHGVLFNMGVLYFAADELDSLDKLGRLNEAEKYFSQYKNELGSSLKKKDPVHKYVKDVEISIKREETRAQREKEQAEREAERERERAAAAAAGAAAGDAGTGGGEDEGWEDEDEGWE